MILGLSFSETRKSDCQEPQRPALNIRFLTYISESTKPVATVAGYGHSDDS